MDDRLRALADTVTVAVVPAAAVDLALPWFTHFPTAQGAEAVEATGWKGLTDRTEGTGWFLIVAVLAAVAGILVGRRALRIAALVITVVCALALLITYDTVGRLDDYDVHAGVGVAVVLAVLAAVGPSLGSAAARRR